MSTPLSDGLYGSDPLLGVADAAREKALARVEALHQPQVWAHRRGRPERCAEDGQPWPCRTRRAIDGEGRAVSLRDLLGRAVLLTPPQPPPAVHAVHYVCPSCDVAGYGAVCWCCEAPMVSAGGLVRVPVSAGLDARELTA